MSSSFDRRPLVVYSCVMAWPESGRMRLESPMITRNLSPLSILVVAAAISIPQGFAQQPRTQANVGTKKAPPKISAEQFHAGLMEKLAKSKGKVSLRKRNPNAGEKGIKPSLAFALQQQRLAAISAHLQTLAPMQTPVTQTGSGGGMLGAFHTLMTPQAQSGSLNTRSAPAPTAVQAAGAPLSVGPSHTMNSTGSKYARAGGPPPTSVHPQKQLINPKAIAPKPLVMCLGPGVRAVNGHAFGTIFTPVPDYNAYTITGCQFGSQPGHVYLIGKFHAPQVDLQIQYWSHNEIDARVDPNISGEIDLNNVSLVIAPTQAPQIKAMGFKFVAARSDPAVLLPSIPSSWVKLAQVNAQNTNFNPPKVPPVYSSPAGGGSIPQAATGDSAYVSRFYTAKFPYGADWFLFNQLAPGWTTDSMQFSNYDQDVCPYIVTYKQTFGNAFAEWVGDNIHVFWEDTSCSGFMPGPLGFPMAVYSNHTGSYYALNVWVRGPRCTDPYTDNPQQKCIQNVKQCGNETCQ
jgi:hypothetical protein